MSSDESFDVVNEFAHIRLTRETGRCGARLKITDLETDASTYLDPLELSGLCEWTDREHLLAVSAPAYQVIEALLRPVGNGVHHAEEVRT